MTTKIDKYIDEHIESYVDDLKRLIRQPSISASGEGIRDCAGLIQELCSAYCFDTVDLLESDGYPSVVARAFVNNDPNNARPTLLIYGHYDTQPVDADQWETLPFEPTIKDGLDGQPRIHARGAGDNKGNHFPHICAVHALRNTTGLPINITLFLDGEEEIGSPHLDAVVDQHKQLLEANFHFGADGSIDESGRPVIKLGSRGLVPIRIKASGANADVHSGHWGGIVPNPVWELIYLFSTMKDRNGCITIDGFYNDVREITSEDRSLLESIPFDVRDITSNFEITDVVEGPGETPMENDLYYPTLNISGFNAGYVGEGFQNSVPAVAQTHIDIRLVMDQKPDDIFEMFLHHVNKYQTGRVDIEIEQLASRAPDRAPLDTPLLPVVEDALQDVWERKPIVYPTSGASGPSDIFYTKLNLPRVNVGYANSDEQQHSPNENMALHCFKKGIKCSVRVIENSISIVS